MGERNDRPLLYMDEYKIKEDAHDYGLADELFDIQTFKRRFRVIIVRYEGDEMEFDMIGIHPAFANTIRRIMLSEVPSMAIEKVYIYNNTSIIQDEVLAHRLGLLPLSADPRLFDYRNDESNEQGGTEQDSLEYELKVKCTRRKDSAEATTPETIFKNHRIYSGQIKWLPRGRQNMLFKESDVNCVQDNILISRMKPGHEFDIKLLAVKGIGKDHAKFSPVSTAFYRLLPEIRLTRVVSGDDAQLLQKCFAPGVIDIDENGHAYVKNARYDTCSRNVFRYPHLADAVVMARVRDHFIFTVESVGALKPHEIVLEAIKVLKAKCKKILHEIEKS